MANEFEMSMIGQLSYFLGLQIKQLKNGTFVSQGKYIKDIIKKFGMSDSKAISTSMGTNINLDSDASGNMVDQKLYRSMFGSVDMETHRHTSKPEGSARWSWRSVWLQRRDNRSCVFLPRCANQFDPAIDKERKFIINLRGNMSVYAQTVPSMPLQEQLDRKSD